MAKPAVARFEITGKDAAALQRFYGNLFDWEIQEGGKGSGFGVVQAAENGISGVIGPAHGGGAGHVTFYVEVEDPAAYLARAAKLGGKTRGASHRGPRVWPDLRLLRGARGGAFERGHPVGRGVPRPLSGRYTSLLS